MASEAGVGWHQRSAGLSVTAYLGSRARQDELQNLQHYPGPKVTMARWQENPGNATELSQMRDVLPRCLALVRDPVSLLRRRSLFVLVACPLRSAKTP
jgi:hypothetical protein